MLGRACHWIPSAHILNQNVFILGLSSSLYFSKSLSMLGIGSGFVVRRNKTSHGEREREREREREGRVIGYL